MSVCARRNSGGISTEIPRVPAKGGEYPLVLLEILTEPTRLPRGARFAGGGGWGLCCECAWVCCFHLRLSSLPSLPLLFTTHPALDKGQEERKPLRPLAPLETKPTDLVVIPVKRRREQAQKEEKKAKGRGGNQKGRGGGAGRGRGRGGKTWADRRRQAQEKGKATTTTTTAAAAKP